MCLDRRRLPEAPKWINANYEMHIATTAQQLQQQQQWQHSWHALPAAHSGQKS